MIPKATEVRLTPEDRAVLEARLRAPTTEQRDAFRARIILLAGEGHSTRSIASTVGTMPRTVSTWRGRFAREGLAGFPGAAATARVRALDRTAHRSRVGRCARAVGLAFPSCPEDRPRQTQILV